MKSYLVAAVSIMLSAGAVNAATVALYEFNGTGTAAVDSTIVDSVGGHDGAVAGGDLLYGADPVLGSYLHFDADGPSVGGLGNRVVIPGSSDLVFGITDSYTIEAIFRTTQVGTNGVIISKGSDVSNPDSQWWIRHQGNGQVRGSMEGDTGLGVEDTATSASGSIYNDGQWHNVSLVYDGTLATRTLSIYVDGILKGQDSNIGTAGIMGGTDADPVVIGEYASLAANRSFSGDIAVVRLSDTALTALEFLPVPEPASFALLACGSALLMFRRRSGTIA